MAKNLVIVESPAKAKTIEKYLGKEYQVESSFGHIADLPSKELGVNVDGDFTPKYKVSSDKKAVVKKLKDLAAKADTVWLASDEDREGEAIAWHLFEQLKLDEDKTKRIVFHEITKNAILNAIENPRGIDYNLVNAQQARRVLDRLVGYELSPVLWRKVKSGLSAGRVQSVAVRLIVEREREIENFKATASYRIDAEFANVEGKKFTARLPKNFETRGEAEKFLNSCIGADFKVADLQTKPARKAPAPPFTTSTLQQEASRKLNFPVAKTMLVAQRLYEAGLITYMRTDSVNLADAAIKAAQQEIQSSYGAKYSKPRNYTSKSKNAQEAHEAIRPTDMGASSISIGYDMDRLYALIWKRTIASQMSEAQLERTAVNISNTKNKEILVANGEVITFDGFLKVYLEGTDFDEEDQAGMLPKMNVNEPLHNNYITATERYTKAPYRFTEASLVKQLEELGIGRPSTYAPTISTIQKRDYVAKGTIEGMQREYTQLKLKGNTISEKLLKEMVGSDKGKLVPTDIGRIVTDFLVDNFENILDFGFTASVEEEFDDIALGKEDWTAMVKGFYTDFHSKVEHVAENAEKAKGERLLGTDPESGKNVYARLGRYGAMIQIGEASDDEKPKFASLPEEQTIENISLKEALDLFKLPKTIGKHEGEDISVANGRFGPYIKYGKKFISLEKGENPLSVDMDRALELIKAKQKADAPIGTYQNLPVTKGVGRFGPFIKWNSMFVNVNKKYNFDSLTAADIIELIEDKLAKDKDKIIHNWESEGIRVEKGRWGRFTIIKGRTKVDLPKDIDAETLTVQQVKELLDKNTSKKKSAKAKTTKK
ncbi:MAG: type I DNA topoisomerase [Flavobacteriaceae bacterium]|nr:type I DNA topoisomerase [Flavobacteriaceae bacterium]